MKRVLGISLGYFLALGFSVVPSSLAAEPFYYAKNSTEARMSYTHRVEFTSEQEPTQDQVMHEIDRQVSYMYGTMFVAKDQAGIKDDYQIWNVQVESVDPESDLYTAYYDYEGTIVVEDGAGDQEYEVIMPINPGAIYEAALVNGSPRNCSTYPHTNEAQFYYYWVPTWRRCPLRENIHYHRVQAKITRAENTERTYPEYERLVNDDGIMRISVLMGMHNENLTWDPYRSGDLNAYNYRRIHSTLRGLGFSSRRWGQGEISDLIGTELNEYPYVEEMLKETKKGWIRVRMYFGPSSLLGGKAIVFHHLLKRAMEKDAVMIYGGHSGYGGNYDLKQIEEAYGFEIEPALERYQIYFFNSCSSYSAYNRAFFNRKKTDADPNGTKNLEVITTGVATYFTDIDDSNIALLRTLYEWAMERRTLSYQKLIHRMDRGNLLGVNGDEDNPTAPASE